MINASLELAFMSFHHALVFRLGGGALGFDSTSSHRAYIFITTRNVIFAATRLNLIGPLGQHCCSIRLILLRKLY